MKWLDTLPLPVIAFVALLLGLAPFSPQPHIWQKLNMLLAGTLVKPIDVFDLLLHSAPLVILLLKLLRMRAATKR